MKLNPNSTQPQIFEHYKHPWYEHNEKLDKEYNFESKSPIFKWDDKKQLIKPNPPTKEAIKKAQFVDKTFVWRHGNRI